MVKLLIPPGYFLLLNQQKTQKNFWELENKVDLSVLILVKNEGIYNRRNC